MDENEQRRLPCKATASTWQERGGDAIPRPASALTPSPSATAGPGAWGELRRVVLVSVGDPNLIDALVLDDATFKDRVSRAVRESGLVSQSAGIGTRTMSAGVVLTAKVDGDFHQTTITFASDGALVTELDVRGEGTMGGMVVSFPPVQVGIAATCRAAQAPWAEVPDGHLVRQVAAVVAVPESEHSPLSLSGKTGGSMRRE